MPIFDGPRPPFVRSTTVLALLLLAVAFSFGSARADTHYVGMFGTDSGNCTNQFTPCATIQYAIDQAASNDTVRIAAGTYDNTSATIQVNKTLEIAGAGCGGTTVKGPVAATPLPAVGGGFPTFQVGLLGVNGPDGVSIHHLSIESNYVAVYANYFKADLSLHDLCVSGGASLIGGYAAGSGGKFHDNVVTDSIFSDIFWTGDDVEISGNQFSGSAQSSILLWDVSIEAASLGVGPILTAEIDGNTITGAQTCPIGSTDFGVISLVGINQATEVAIENNVIRNGFGAGIGMRTVGANIQLKGNQVFGQEAVEETSDGISCARGGTQDPARIQEANGVVISGSSIPPEVSLGGADAEDGNVFAKNSGAGIAVEVSDAVVTAECTRLQDNEHGIAASVSVDVTATNGSIVGNAAFGVAAQTTPAIDASGNWWGCASGPGNAGCDSVDGPVVASGPLGSAPQCGVCAGTDESITSAKVTYWPRRSKAGRIKASGVIPAVDVSHGVSLSFNDGLNLSSISAIPAADCVIKGAGKKIKCRSADKTALVSFRRLRDSSYSFKATVKHVDSTNPKAGPIAMAVVAGAGAYGSCALDCVNHNAAKLTCEGPAS